MSPEPATVAGIDPLRAARLVEDGAFLLDVREDEEWATGHAPEAVHVTMGLVAERLDEIPAERTVVCVCRVGRRSATVAALLEQSGYDVRNLDGGMLAWEVVGLAVVTDSGESGRIA